MNTKEFSGRRQMEFLAGFDFVREAGTAGEVKAAKMIRDTLDSFGVKNWMEEFDFWGFRINRAVLKVMEPYQKEYVVTGYGRCGNTGEEGLKAPFLYVENGDAVSLSRAKGKIVMVNPNTIVIETSDDRVRMELTKWAVSQVGVQTGEQPEAEKKEKKAEKKEETPAVEAPKADEDEKN